MATREQTPQSASEALVGDNPFEKLSRRDRIRLKIINRLGLGKETEQYMHKRVSDDLDGITQQMRTALETENKRRKTNETGAECMVQWGDGSDQTPTTWLTAQYRQLEDGSEAVSINAHDGTENDGTTVITRSADGTLGVDVANSGQTVPLSQMSPTEKLTLMPILNGLNQDIGTEKSVITIGAHEDPWA